MDGIHDMGGMDGFGSVYPEPNEPVFHEHWEGRVLALNRAMGASGTWTIDTGRFGIELLPPDVYLDILPPLSPLGGRAQRGLTSRTNTTRCRSFSPIWPASRRARVRPNP